MDTESEAERMTNPVTTADGFARASRLHVLRYVLVIERHAICDAVGWIPRLAVFVLFLLPSLHGCGRGDGIQRVTVSGSVTFRGQPVEVGQIRFVPESGTAAPLVTEPIADGRYATSTSGGVAAGHYRVEIRAFDSSAPKPMGPGDPPWPQLLAEKYNARSQLTANVESDEREKTLDFHLK